MKIQLPCWYLSLWCLSGFSNPEQANRHVMRCVYCQYRIQHLQDSVDSMRRVYEEQIMEEVKEMTRQ